MTGLESAGFDRFAIFVSPADLAGSSRVNCLPLVAKMLDRHNRSSAS
jgi:hypothetical protein